MTDVSLDWLISVDDHILEPPHLWVDRVSAKDRDRVPHMITTNEGEFWTYDGKRYPGSGLNVALKSTAEFTPDPVGYDEMRPGCYDSKARLEDMDRAGILASLCFPSVTRFCGQLFWEGSDHDLGYVCIKAYNDWMVEEWCGAAPGRYIPLVLIPLWDPTLAAIELERCAGMGVTAFAFSENPVPLGLPSIHDENRYWDPLMAAANDLNMVVCMHVGSSSQIPQITPDAPVLANLAWGATRTSGTMLSWIFSGMFDKFPNLNIALSEGEIGWIPYFLERAAQVLRKQRHWVMSGHTFMDHVSRTDAKLDTLDVHQTFRDHIYGCFIDDIHGVHSLDEIGEDNVMCETDYPHSDSTWPNCIDIVKSQISDLPRQTQYKLLRGNAERLYRFTPAPIPTP